MDVLSCPSCNVDIPISEFPVEEGKLAECYECNLKLVVAVDQDDDAPHGAWAFLREQDCDDCERSGEDCARCAGTGDEPALTCAAEKLFTCNMCALYRLPKVQPACHEHLALLVEVLRDYEGSPRELDDSIDRLIMARKAK